MDASEPVDPEALATAIGDLYDRLTATLAPDDRTRVAELTRLLGQLYSAGLDRVVELLRERADAGTLDAVVADPLIASLLIAHGLHPDGDVTADSGNTRPARPRGPVPLTLLPLGERPS